MLVFVYYPDMSIDMMWTLRLSDLGS